MMLFHSRWTMLPLVALILPVAGLAMDHSCASYGEREQAVMARFAGDDLPVPTGKTPATLHLGTVYNVHAMPQAGYPFVANPSRAGQDEGAYAAMLAFRVEHSGRYRVYIDDASWVDLVDDTGTVLAAANYGGRHHCRVLRKYVAYGLEAGHRYVVQLSGGTREQVRVMVEAVADPASATASDG